jgi:hypothetical protein
MQRKSVAVRARIGYILVMVKDPLNVRFGEDEREALERAAAADDRPLSAMVRKIVVDWLRRGGWLAKAKKERKK